MFQSAHGYREIVAAETGPQFFNVLGVGPSFGSGLDGPDTFVASYDFWKSHLGASRAAVGERFEIGGRSLRLAGVMPRSFSFLSEPVAVWTAAAGEPAVDRLAAGSSPCAERSRAFVQASRRTPPKKNCVSFWWMRTSPAQTSTSAPRPSPIWCTGPRGRTRWTC